MLSWCCHTFFRPAHNFLGCFTLSFGVKLLMWPHLILSVYYVAYVVARLISDDGGFFDMSQILATLMSLIGIPSIAIGLYGVYNRLEPQVRIYFYYLALCVAIDLYYIVDMFILRDSCTHVKLINHMHGGRAFACGIAQSISNLSAGVAALGAFYMIYIVWSWCEVAEGGQIDRALQSLLAMSEGKPLVAKPRSHQMLGQTAYPGMGYPGGPGSMGAEYSVGMESEIVSGLADTVDAGLEAANSVGMGARIVYGAVVHQVTEKRQQASQLVNENLEDLEGFAVGRASKFQ